MTRIFEKRYAIFWIIALAFALRLIGIGKSFQGDEFLSIIDARHFNSIPEALLSDTHPPLYFYLLHFWMKISTGEAFLRILSIMPGLGLCAVTYFLGKNIAGEAVGNVSALVSAVAPIAVWSSQYIRTYSLAAFFTALSVIFLIRLLERDGSVYADWAGYVVSSAAAIYTFYFSGLIIIAENIFVVFFIRNKGFIKKWIASQFAIFILYIPWVPYFIFQRSAYIGHPQMVERVGLYLGDIHVGAIIRSAAGLAGFDPRLLSKGAVSANTLFAISGVIAFIGALAMATIVIVIFLKNKIKSSHQDMGLSLLLFLSVAPFIMALILHQTLGIILMSHYFIASFIFLSIFLVAVIMRLAPKKIQYVLLAAVLLFYSARLLAMYRDKEMDFKSAYRYVKTSMSEDAVLISPSFGGIFDHYFSDIPAREHMEDVGKGSILNKEVIAITYPEKLELKETHRRFRSILSSRQYRLDGSEAFGDLVLERYSG